MGWGLVAYCRRIRDRQVSNPLGWDGDKYPQLFAKQKGPVSNPLGWDGDGIPPRNAGNLDMVSNPLGWDGDFGRLGNSPVAFRRF